MYKYKAKVERVIDGDTLEVTIDLGFKITTVQKLRLAGINTPETYNVKKNSEEYQKGMLSKNYVEKRISENNNMILIETEKVPEKYGRYVTKVWLENPDKTLNDELVEKGLAVYVQY